MMPFILWGWVMQDFKLLTRQLLETYLGLSFGCCMLRFELLRLLRKWLWAYSKGDVYCPTHQLFLSQKPYLPQGSLLTALAYPNEEQAFNCDEMVEVLKQVSLGHLQDRLEQEQDWTRILSLGEQQRLAFARLLLHKPKVAFLDEATASMDEGLEDTMYRLLKERLPNTTVISVGHRSTLQAFHQQQLMILGNGKWRFTDRNLV